MNTNVLIEMIYLYADAFIIIELAAQKSTKKSLPMYRHIDGMIRIVEVLKQSWKRDSLNGKFINKSSN